MVLPWSRARCATSRSAAPQRQQRPAGHAEALGHEASSQCPRPHEFGGKAAVQRRGPERERVTPTHRERRTREEPQAQHRDRDRTDDTFWTSEAETSRLTEYLNRAREKGINEINIINNEGEIIDSSDPEKIGKLIGPGGKTIRGFQDQYKVKIDVEKLVADMKSDLNACENSEDVTDWADMYRPQKPLLRKAQQVEITKLWKEKSEFFKQEKVDR